MRPTGGEGINRETTPLVVTVNNRDAVLAPAEKTIRLPSGDHRGFGSSYVGIVSVVRTLSSEPSSWNMTSSGVDPFAGRRRAAIVPLGTMLTYPVSATFPAR